MPQILLSCLMIWCELCNLQYDWIQNLTQPGLKKMLLMATQNDQLLYLHMQIWTFKVTVFHPVYVNSLSIILMIRTTIT